MGSFPAIVGNCNKGIKYEIIITVALKFFAPLRQVICGECLVLDWYGIHKKYSSSITPRDKLMFKYLQAQEFWTGPEFFMMKNSHPIYEDLVTIGKE